VKNPSGVFEKIPYPSLGKMGPPQLSKKKTEVIRYIYFLGRKEKRKALMRLDLFGKTVMEERVLLRSQSRHASDPGRRRGASRH